MIPTQIRPMQQFLDEFRIDCTPEDGKIYTVSIRTSEEAVVRAVEVLHLILGVSDRVRHAMGNTASQVRANATLKLREAQHRSLSRRYWEHRGQGLKHRAALDLVLETDLAKNLHYTRAEIYHCIKAYPEESVTITYEPKGVHHELSSEAEREIDRPVPAVSTRTGADL